MTETNTEHTPEDQDTLSTATGGDLSAPEPTDAESPHQGQENASQSRTEAQEDDGREKKPQTPIQKARKEAAAYRTRAREAEERSEALQARVEALEWAEVERHLPKGSPKLEGLQKLGLELDEVKDDDGNIDPEKVHQATVAASELVGVSIGSQAPRMPLEGRAPSSTLMDKGVQAKLASALGIK